MTRDSWHVTHDIWHVGEDEPSQQFQLPSSYGLWVNVFWKDISTKDELLNKSVCRTAPATPSLLKKQLFNAIFFLKQVFFPLSSLQTEILLYKLP